ncbi:hypothetical protein TCAL_15276 [Tigriopus californicus]|uniref:C2H2-type domain-containing protein n=1 Tax=Tigriopus californicus TaxID=6832 RepID=A0A553NFV5_TIGCA|nr:hypothetical protein TCAL_15276 [Tigriopus californicus]
MATPTVGEAQPPEAISPENFMPCLSKKFRYKYRSQHQPTPREPGSSNHENITNLEETKAPSSTSTLDLAPPPNQNQNHDRKNVLQTSSSMNRLAPFIFKEPHNPCPRVPLVVKQPTLFKGLQAPNPEAKPESNRKSDQGVDSGLDSGPDQELEHSLERVSVQEPSQELGQDSSQTPSQDSAENSSFETAQDLAQDQGQHPLHVNSQNLEPFLKPAQELNEVLSRGPSQERLNITIEERVKESTQGSEPVQKTSSSYLFEEDSESHSVFDLIPLNLSVSLPTSPREELSARSVESLSSGLTSLRKESSSMGSPRAIEEPTSSTTPSPPRASAQPDSKDITRSPSLNDVSSSTTSQASKSEEVPSTSGAASKRCSLFSSSNDRSGRKPGSCAPRFKSCSLPSMSGLEPTPAMEIPQASANRKRAQPRRMSGGITFHPHPYVDRQMRSNQNVVLHKTNQYFDCPSCTKSYYTQKDLDQHIKHKHMLLHPK